VEDQEPKLVTDLCKATTGIILEMANNTTDFLMRACYLALTVTNYVDRYSKKSIKGKHLSFPSVSLYFSTYVERGHS
jgi:hypothetical protein